MLAKIFSKARLWERLLRVTAAENVHQIGN